MKLLLFSDIHGFYNFNDIYNQKEDYDACFILGDTEWFTLKEIVRIIPQNKLYGILGNHDNWNLYERHGVNNIHGKLINIDSITFTGFQGSERYSSANRPMYSQEESLKVARELPKADVLLSHTSNYLGGEDEAHTGLIGIDEYIKLNHPKYVFHGHHHENTTRELGNTKIIGLYKMKTIEI